MDGGSSLLRAVLRLSLERTIYLIVLTVCGITSAWTIFHESVELEGSIKHSRQLGPGWYILGIKRDIANFEWTFWFSDLRESILLCLIVHVILSYVFTRYLPWAKGASTTLFCAYCVQATLGGTFLSIVLLLILMFYAINTTLKSSKMCWFLTISSILLLHFDGFYMKMLPPLLEVNENFLALGYLALGFTVLRSCSFFMEHLHNEKLEKNYSVMSLLRYNFYLPYFFFGPVMTYDIYAKKKSLAPSKGAFFDLLTESLKIAFMVMTVDFLLHFIHISSIALDHDYLQKAPSYVVGFVLFGNVLMDWMKAAVLYGVTSGIARVADGYSEAPTGPPCTAKICTFANTYFDRGIQHWVSRYIYSPIGDKHIDLAKETFASVMTFAFVAIWQGLGTQVMTFVVLSCMGLTFEFFVSQMTPTEDKKNKRIAAFFLGLNYWCILLFTTVAVSGIDTAFLSFKSLCLGGTIVNLLTTLCLGYCYAAFITLAPQTKEKRQ